MTGLTGEQSIPNLDVVKLDPDLASSCVHCGFCLEVCPTYKLTGDENNSPRGRLRLWREESEGKLEKDAWTDFYTSECVGCLACESACPAAVPYGKIFEAVRHQHVATGRSRPKFLLRMAARLAAMPQLMSLVFTPIRWMRRNRLMPGLLNLPGDPPTLESTASLAARLMRQHRPTGPKVALLTGCLMESAFREINAATVRVLIANNVQVMIPNSQTCCGAFQEHCGLDGVDRLHEANRRAFSQEKYDAILSNSSGCGYALQKSLGSEYRVRDVLSFLGDLDLKKLPPRSASARVYVDLPCHLVHGQRVKTIPNKVLDATGYHWELAPNASDCCGSGGVYNLEKPANALDILKQKSAFLENAAGDPVILATANHVCMMQWNSAITQGVVRRPFQVKHVIQLLDTH